MITQDWNGTAITFTSDETHISKYSIPKGYVNATQMCKANGKLWADYKRLKNTNEYFEALSADMGIAISELVITIIGDNLTTEQGTWVHPDIAIDLGAWISSQFRVWINKQIRTLLETGKVELEQKPMTMIELFEFQLNITKQQEQRLTSIEEENNRLKQELIIVRSELLEQTKEVKQVKQLTEIHELEIVANSCELERFSNGSGRWFSVIAFAKLKELPCLSLEEAKVLGRKASALCKTNNIKPSKVTDPRFGEVNTYPDYILEEVI